MDSEAPKLQKAMARAGYGSRRACERMIREGRVTVNGERAKLGLRVELDRDVILIDGKPMRSPEPLAYLMLYKPPGVLSSLSAQGDWPTVIDLVEIGQRVYPVGRLDLESEGLVLLTNDGELAHSLTHPSFGHEKECRVRFDRIPSEDQLRSWRDGVSILELGRTLPAEIWLEDPADKWARIIIRQGMKRQIRETAKVLNLKVERLIRVRMADLELGDLGPGEWRYLTLNEVENLRFASSEPIEVR